MPVAISNGMTSNFALATIAGGLALMLAAMVAGFLLMVPALSVATVAVILVAMTLIFALGMHAGGRRIRIRRPHAQ